jgi:DNA-binding transcriptional MerR regulator
MREKKASYSIAELSREFDITPRAIRHYEDKKLLSPKREGTQRVYQLRDYVRLQLIMRGKRIGFSLDEIGEIIEMYDLPSGKEKQTELLTKKIHERREALYQQKRDIAHMLQELVELEKKITPSS